MTEVDVVNYLINLDDELRNTYWLYQNLLYAFKKKNFNLLKISLQNFNNNYHNGYIEGNNNFIEVLKRIAFGFRSFRRFKARIMICKGLIKIKRANT